MRTLVFYLFLVYATSMFGCRETAIPDYSGKYQGVVRGTRFIGAGPNLIVSFNDTVEVTVRRNGSEYTMIGPDSTIIPITLTRSDSFVYTYTTDSNSTNNGSGTFGQQLVEINGGWIFTYPASEYIDTLVTKISYTFTGKRI